MGITFAFDEELERCEAALWAPPSSLTVENIGALENEPRLRLTQIIRLMVGKCVNPNEEAKQSRQAAKAIFDSVKRLDRPVMFGSRDDGDLEAISPAYFDTPRYVYEVTARFPWHRVPAIDECDVGGDVGEDPMKQRRWKNVRVERAWVVGWLRNHVCARSSPPKDLSTTAQEHKAIDKATTLLREKPWLTKDALEKQLRDAGLEFSGAGYKNRIWPKARLAAGLSAKGFPGAPTKEKSNR